MAKFIASVKAIITRLVFACHGLIAIWQVTNLKGNPLFWYLCCPIILLFFEGMFTLTIKANQEWKWFCPSVFLYLGSVVPAIWLLELDRVERRLQQRANDTLELSSAQHLAQLQRALGVSIRLPQLRISRDTWLTLLQQFLMLILIVGRWMLPKGELTRDQLSQLLLAYIGTAADIIEFFDSLKEDRVAREALLVCLTLAIWSWSLMQFTVVLTASRSRKCRAPPASLRATQRAHCCGGIDVWAIAINIVLQDAPFLAFRLVLIAHYQILSYMNVFFTCKNSLVILLQLYRLYVVQSEAKGQRRRRSRRPRPDPLPLPVAHAPTCSSGSDEQPQRPERRPIRAPRPRQERRERRQQRRGRGQDHTDTDTDTDSSRSREDARRPRPGRDVESARRHAQPRRKTLGRQRRQSQEDGHAETTSEQQIKYARSKSRSKRH